MQTRLPDGSVMVCGGCSTDAQLERVGQYNNRLCKLELAVGKRTPQGSDRSETVRCNVVAWHGLAEVLAQARKGDPVFVIGRLQSREWEGKTYTDLVAEYINVCALAPNRTARRAGPSPRAMPPITGPDDPLQELTTPDDQLPF